MNTIQTSQKYTPRLHLKSQLRLRPSVKFKMHILAPSDKRLPMHAVHLPRLNKCFFSPGFCLYKHKLIYPSKDFNDLLIVLELPSQFLQAHQSADRSPNV